ncbi:MAG: hypothetical protein JJU11_17195 [Candidatus Sumerlaeia bacterium]|nr:hypothetical protein [Candidatus Sumerlaeia bacterium]
MNTNTQGHSSLPRSTFSISRTKRRLLGYHRAPMPRWHKPTTAVTELLDWFRNPAHLVYSILFLLLCLVYIVQASIHWISVIDDAYITFRFVDMFSQGHGWRYSPDGPRVEGFTNFLWAVILLVPHSLGGDLMYWSKILGMASGMLTMAAAWRLAAVIRGRDDLLNLLAPAFLATNTHFGHWAMMGLETLLQAALVTATYYRFEKERRDPRCWLISPLIAFLAATTRIDSLYYLSPLGLYGWWLVSLRRYPVKRLLLWGVMAAIPFIGYTAWRVSYFGDFFPNTYYAKQRMVVNEGHGRGIGHLREFYFNQAGYGMRSPTETPVDMGDRWVAFLHGISLASHNSLLWMNFWILGGGLVLLAASTTFLIRRRIHGRRLNRFLAQPHTAMMFCLILLPWALNVYYVYHVNGDWMPGFRFLQVVLPFIGVAGAVGLGWVATSLAIVLRRRLHRLISRACVTLVAAWLVVGQAYEQMDIGYIYIFGRQDVHAGAREQGWWRWDRVGQYYQRGFVPPLEYVSNWMMLNTQDDSWIFMSDIGQPLWFAEHLSLYDVDGLTDPYLAHSPTVRGDLPTVEEHFAQIVSERGEPANREIANDWMMEAHRRDFEAHLERNAAYIMEDRQPEYLLIFKNHETASPNSRGWPYPQISERVYNHPNMENYVHMAAIPKVGNVHNHFYRRKDVEEHVPDEVKFNRILRALERNPRMPLLDVLLFEKSMELELTPAQEEQVRHIVIRSMNRWAADPIIPRLARLAQRSQYPELAEEALIITNRRNPGSVNSVIALVNLYVDRRDFDKAISVMEDALPHQPPYNNQLFYHMVWLAERAGDLEMARLYARKAVDRIPDDARAWTDLGSLLDRSAQRRGTPPQAQLALRHESIAAFRRAMEILGQEPDYMTATINRLETQIERITERSDQ